MLASMISYIKQEEKAFTVREVLAEIGEKLIRRHPHVFGDTLVTDSKDVIKQWDNIKRDVEGKRGDESILDTVPPTLPPLEKAYRLQKKAAKVGFDWKERADVVAKLLEEVDELEKLGAEPLKKEVENELGDLLFAAVNLCRHCGIDPAIALHTANAKFFRRFNYIEKKVESMGKTLSKDEFQLMDELWDEAKSREK